MTQLTPIPIFNDNYVWVLSDEQQAWVVDPGLAEPVIEYLDAHALALAAILITHHHPDHVGGCEKLKVHYDCPIYGPTEEAEADVTHPIPAGETLTLSSDLHFKILDVPGHTLGHIAYVGEHYLFCGDALFSCGCGRVFEGTPHQMWQSLERLKKLPPELLVCCTHEYTEANLRFALAVEPKNNDLMQYANKIARIRAQGLPSLPSNLGLERQVNPFLRCEQTTVKAAAEKFAGHALTTEAEIFAALRAWKDVF